MKRRKNQSDSPGKPAGQGVESPDQTAIAGSLHVFSPADLGGLTSGQESDTPAVSTEPVSEGDCSPSANVVAGFAGHAIGADRRRCTLYLSPELDAQLGLVAHLEHKERSQIVESLLRQHLPKYRVERA